MSSAVTEANIVAQEAFQPSDFQQHAFEDSVLEVYLHY